MHRNQFRSIEYGIRCARGASFDRPGWELGSAGELPSCVSCEVARAGWPPPPNGSFKNGYATRLRISSPPPTPSHSHCRAPLARHCNCRQSWDPRSREGRPGCGDRAWHRSGVGPRPRGAHRTMHVTPLHSLGDALRSSAAGREVMEVLSHAWARLKPGGLWHPQYFIEHQGHWVVEAVLLIIITYLLFQNSQKPPKSKEKPLSKQVRRTIPSDWAGQGGAPSARARGAPPRSRARARATPRGPPLAHARPLFPPRPTRCRKWTSCARSGSPSRWRGR